MSTTNKFNPDLIAGGTVRPSRFVKASVAADNTGLECDEGELPVGVVTGANLESDSDNNATTTDGENSLAFQPGRIIEVKCGGTIVRGIPIGPDADGLAVHGAGAAAIPLESGLTGAVIRAMLVASPRDQAVQHFTAADTLTVWECGKVCTNLGATGAVALTLPQDAKAGCWFEFCVMAAQQLRVDPGAAGAFYFSGAKQTDDKYIWADDEAESLKVIADGNGDWIAIAYVGTWTMQT